MTSDKKTRRRYSAAQKAQVLAECDEPGASVANCPHGQRAVQIVRMAATPADMLVGERKPKKMSGVSAEQMAKMEKEMGNVHGQYKSIEHSYGQDVLNLVLAKGYLKNLLDNEAVFRFLSMRQPDVLREFSNLVEVDALDK